MNFLANRTGGFLRSQYLIRIKVCRIEKNIARAVKTEKSGMPMVYAKAK